MQAGMKADFFLVISICRLRLVGLSIFTQKEVPPFFSFFVVALNLNSLRHSHVGSQLQKGSRKRLAHDVVDIFATLSSLVYVITNTD